MDLQTILDKIETDFYIRLLKKPWWSTPEIKDIFNDAVGNVLITTYSRVIKDAKEK